MEHIIHVNGNQYNVKVSDTRVEAFNDVGALVLTLYRAANTFMYIEKYRNRHEKDNLQEIADAMRQIV